MNTYAVFWLIGYSGAGKTTIARALEKYYDEHGKKLLVIDGDILRRGLNSDLAYTRRDREENLRRTRELVDLYRDLGHDVVVSFITPYESERKIARDMFGDSYVEIFVDTPIEVCQAEDYKGLYAKAIAGEIQNMTGVTHPFEIPKNPDVVAKRDDDLDELVERIIEVWTRKKQ